MIVDISLTKKPNIYYLNSHYVYFEATVTQQK